MPKLRYRVVDWLIKRAQRTPYYHITGYMNRWKLVTLPWFECRVHEILRGDNDRDLHDHPALYIAVILRCGYFEERPMFRNDPTGPRTCKWHGPGSVLIRWPWSPHRLLLRKGESTWTLFTLLGPHRRDKGAGSWGFYTPAGYVPWRKYP